MTYPYSNYVSGTNSPNSSGWTLPYAPTITQAPYIPQAPMPTQNPVQPTQQMQNGGLVYVSSEEEAINYPVAPGYWVTLILYDKTYCYIKTMGFSQYDKPTIEKYKMIKEESVETEKAEKKELDLSKFALRSDVDRLRTDIKKLKDKVAISDV